MHVGPISAAAMNVVAMNVVAMNELVTNVVARYRAAGSSAVAFAAACC